MTATMKPTIHPNGTHPETLLEGMLDAKRAVLAAFDALVAAAPNARDYHVCGPEAFSLANREHVARLDALTGIVSDLDALAEHVANSTVATEDTPRAA